MAAGDSMIGDLFYLALGGLTVLAFQICAYGAREMEELDASEESWKSIMFLEENKGK